MYAFVRGPLLWAAVLVLIAGVIYRAIQLYKLTRQKEQQLFNASGAQPAPSSRSAEEQQLERVVRFQHSLLGKHPVMAIVSTVFHGFLFAAPIFVMGHSLELYKSMGISFISLPDGLIDVMTMVVLACGLFFLMRRLVLPRVQAVSSLADYLLLFATIAPFLTGFFAYHQWFDYKTVITLHVLAGDLMLIAIPFTKLGHMVFFFFVRLLIGGEYSFGRGTRTWSS